MKRNKSQIITHVKIFSHPSEYAMDARHGNDPGVLTAAKTLRYGAATDIGLRIRDT